jgi:hypothetical protein
MADICLCVSKLRLRNQSFIVLRQPLFVRGERFIVREQSLSVHEQILTMQHQTLSVQKQRLVLLLFYSGKHGLGRGKQRQEEKFCFRWQKVRCTARNVFH